MAGGLSKPWAEHCKTTMSKTYPILCPCPTYILVGVRNNKKKVNEIK